MAAYRKIEKIGAGEQWEKTYDDGLTAKVYVVGKKITLSDVQSAFMKQERAHFGYILEI